LLLWIPCLSSEDSTLPHAKYVSFQSTGAIIVLLNAFSDSVLVSGTQASFGVNGKTASFPSQQFQVQTWNTCSNPYPKFALTSSPTPTYVLNAYNYSYASNVLTVFGQQSNQTITVNYGYLVGVVSIYYATSVINSAPIWNPSSQTIQKKGIRKPAKPVTAKTILLLHEVRGKRVPELGNRFRLKRGVRSTTRVLPAVLVVERTRRMGMGDARQNRDSSLRRYCGTDDTETSNFSGNPFQRVVEFSLEDPAPA
jgi:hypothetical protein